MVSVLPGSLSKSDEAVVRKLFKVIRATKYEDPVDQDAFLVESANTVLQFCPQVASFALVADLGECVFTLRAMMHTTGARLGTPFSDAFVSIQDFAGEILRKRQAFRAHKRANEDRIRVAEGMAARVERNIARELASNLNKSPVSPSDDVVSIPSSSDESGVEEPSRIVKNLPPSPIQAEPGHSQPSSQAKLSIVTKPLPTGPRAGLHPKPAPTSRKRRRVEAGEDSSSLISSGTPLRPAQSPVQHPTPGSAPVRPAAAASEEQLRRRLAAVQAEMRRLDSAQKELYWQLQALHQPQPIDSAPAPQVRPPSVHL
ncbi:hypothetical protein B0H10DRAFT_1942033 [Mycena sp. CBHHK59/15]|nr:hypothetical protein B0H10DRAFT_1942033 [Mycena sp. CBHHK59/15]